VEVQYYLDPETGLPHIYKHGVTEEEVEEVLANADEDRPGRDDLREASGRTAAGRPLLVITGSRITEYS